MKQHTDHMPHCKELNHKGIMAFFKLKLAKIHSFHDKIIGLIEEINNYMSLENPLDGHQFMNLINRVLSFGDLLGMF